MDFRILFRFLFCEVSVVRIENVVFVILFLFFSMRLWRLVNIGFEMFFKEFVSVTDCKYSYAFYNMVVFVVVDFCVDCLSMYLSVLILFLVLMK